MKLERFVIFLAMGVLVVSYLASTPQDIPASGRSVPVAAPAPAGPPPATAQAPTTAPSAAATARPPDSPAPAKPADAATGRKSNQSSKRDCGSAAKLAGHVHLCNLFVSDAQSRWNDAARRTALQRTDDAARFMAAHAKRYNVEVTFTQETLREAVCPTTIPTDMFANPHWIESCLRSIRYDSANALVKARQADTRCDGCVLVLHVNKKATSYNLTFYEGVHSSFHAERVVMFLNYKDGRPTCAASYAHEILHSFGAGELYFPFDAAPARKQAAAKFFPNDVMHRVDYDLGKLSIDHFTAYRVGWLDSLDPRYKVFED